MAYSDFTLERVSRTLNVRILEADLFPKLATVAVPIGLTETLAKRTQLATLSEKARSEFIVVPILLTCRDLSPLTLAIYSGQRLDVDAALGLVGECDFILSLAPPVPPLRAPIATIVEAKKNDIEVGVGQCVAQMVAARIFNQAADRGTSPVFGCVTTGEAWQFLRLDGDEALIDRRRFYIDDPGGILAALLCIIAAASTL